MLHVPIIVMCRALRARCRSTWLGSDRPPSSILPASSLLCSGLTGASEEKPSLLISCDAMCWAQTWGRQACKYPNVCVVQTQRVWRNTGGRKRLRGNEEKKKIMRKRNTNDAQVTSPLKKGPRKVSSQSAPLCSCASPQAKKSEWKNAPSKEISPRAVRGTQTSRTLTKIQ